jgi:hypothetical protein
MNLKLKIAFTCPCVPGFISCLDESSGRSLVRWRISDDPASFHPF